ncbi:MAG: right-handed parallel beta-helix repeat-containing protein [Planctomycetes bacterium]|nr:right-handed parallel beta-helix repeat-containing protein [Planctomycetota bacterium]
MRAALLVGALLVTITSYTEAGNTVYVDADATGPVHDGSSWCSAYLDLQQALAVAGAGTEIRVAQGVYRPASAGGSREAAFAVPSDVTLLGSFQGCGTPDPDERDYLLYATVLSGDLDGDDGPNFANRTDNVYHVVTTHDVSAATVLDGLTIRGGHADGPNAGPSVDSRDQGSGVNNYHGQPTLSNCTLVDNFAANHGTFNDHGDATLTDCTFKDNRTDNIAAGLYSHFDAVSTVTGCRFENNATAGDGGGAYLKGTNASVFTDCVFTGNEAVKGGGLYIQGGSNPRLTSCTFVDNRAEERGGGLYTQESTVTLDGCSFSADDNPGSSAFFGGGLYASDSEVIATDCAFLDHTLTGNLNGDKAKGGGLYALQSSVTLESCTISGNAVYGGAEPLAGGGGGVYAEDTNLTLSNCTIRVPPRPLISSCCPLNSASANGPSSSDAASALRSLVDPGRIDGPDSCEFRLGNLPPVARSSTARGAASFERRNGTAPVPRQQSRGSPDRFRL